MTGLKSYLNLEEEIPKNMSGMECIYHAIGRYKNQNPKLYWIEEECVSDVLALLRMNKQDSKENIELGVKVVGERLSKKNIT